MGDPEEPRSTDNVLAACACGQMMHLSRRQRRSRAQLDGEHAPPTISTTMCSSHIPLPDSDPLHLRNRLVRLPGVTGTAYSRALISLETRYLGWIAHPSLAAERSYCLTVRGVVDTLRITVRHRRRNAIAKLLPPADSQPLFFPPSHSRQSQ